MVIKIIYLDNAATAKYRNIDDIIVNTITTAMTDSWMNPSSLYATNIKNRINKCRTNIAKFIGADVGEIYFTSCGSESNSWALQGFVNKCLSEHKMPCIIASTIEHKSIMECANNFHNINVEYVNVDNDGVIDVEQLKNKMFIKTTCGYKILVSIQFANNEIGTIQNIKQIAKEVHKFNGILHTDSVQAFGHIPINVEELGIDMMSCSGHKISPALRGIGFLYKKNNVNIQPLIYGTQESNMRGGTEWTYGILGLEKAIQYCDVSYEAMGELCEKRDYFIALLESEFGCKLNGHGKYRLPNNINVTFPQNITGESLLYILDMSDVKASTSSACNSKSIEPSHVLKAIGLSDEDAMRSVRFTLSNDITYEDIDKTIKEIKSAIKLIEIN